MSRKRPRFQIYRDAAGEWRWRLRAANGRIVAQGESHPRRADALRAIRAMRAAAIAADADNPEVG